MNAALLVIDLQEHFFEETPGLLETALLPNVDRMLRAARRLGLPVIHIITMYKADQSNWPQAWREHGDIWCLEGSRGALVRPEATPANGEIVLEKTRFSAFYETQLQETLARLRIDTLLIAGYSCDVCIRMTTLDAYNRGYRIFIVEDGTESMREPKEQALEYLRWLTRTEMTCIGDLGKFISRSQ
jgi:nicotinamidase-related amidase